MKIELFTDLKNACHELIAVLPKLNASQRKEMRELLIKLKEDLSDSLTIAEQYLLGAKRSTRPRKFSSVNWSNQAESA